TCGHRVRACTWRNQSICSCSCAFGCSESSPPGARARHERYAARWVGEPFSIAEPEGIWMLLSLVGSEIASGRDPLAVIVMNESVSAGERIAAAVLGWPGVERASHRFGGIEFRLGKRELGHVHGDTLVDLPFPRKVRDELVSSRRARPHVLPDTG